MKRVPSQLLLSSINCKEAIHPEEWAAHLYLKRYQGLETTEACFSRVVEIELMALGTTPSLKAISYIEIRN
jgi:hypothetical protein